MQDNENNNDLKEVSIADLRADKARLLAGYLSADLYDYASIEGCYQVHSYDVIKICVEVQVPQKKVNDIRSQELFFIACDLNDAEEPRVLPSRDDFPKVPHIDIHQIKIAGIASQSLCLSNIEYSNRKLRWTPYLFLEDIRAWLSKTAIDELHPDDQALEPFLFRAAITLVVSQEFIDQHIENNLVEGVSFCANFENAKEMVIFTEGDFSFQSPREQNFQALVFEVPAVVHGVINRNPRDLMNLHSVLESTGFDLLSSIRNVLTESEEKIDKGKHLLLIIRIPKKRSEDGPIEGNETYAFSMPNSFVGDVGEDIGVYQKHDSTFGRLIPIDLDKNGENTKIETLNVVEPFTPGNAQKFSGCSNQNFSEKKIVAIGLGAIGSQVFDKLFRSGVGKWALIDKDTLLPHNLSRHQLDGSFIGFSKAIAMQQLARSHMPLKEWLGLGAFQENILEVEEHNEMKEVVDDAEVIVDFSAAESVTKFLSFYEGSEARRLSSYAFSSASLLVYMCEDQKRKIRLDYLDMCLYRQFLYTPQIFELFSDGTIEKFRYGGACGDVTVAFPNGLMSIFSGIVAEKIKESLIEDGASAEVWIATDDFSIENIKVPFSKEIRIQMGDWEIVTDEIFIEKVRGMRKDALPNETGGVLIGSYDFVRKKVYVADFIPSPEDSKEWPTGYIRGCEGLVEAVGVLEAMSLWHFQYIGEWHSHPDGSSSNPSETDKKAMRYFKEHMDKACLPTLMLIVGEKDETWIVE